MPSESSTSSFSGQAEEVTNKVKSSFNDATAGAKEKASEYAQKAADTIDANRGSAASTLETAASTLHDHAASLPGGEKVANLAHTAADRLGATAQYVRDHDTKQVMSDVQSFVKSYPGQSLLAAAIVGFLAGRAFRND